VEQIARSLDQKFEFELQSAGYSLLRERTRGADRTAADYSGYRSGNNRSGSGLDVARELRAPTRLSAGARYDALVVTERHDLPAVAREEQTATYLTHIAQQLLAGNPQGEIFLYHTWLNLNVEQPLAWVEYERSVRRLWECVASRANLNLGGSTSVPRIRLLPGASALAELVLALWNGKVPGLSGREQAERVRLLFRDDVHLSDTGRYFLGLVHYAALYGRSPEGAAVPQGLARETATFMQRLAFRHVEAYGHVASGAARRNMEACRSFAQREACPSYHQLRSGHESGLLAGIKRKAKVYGCQRSYGGADDAENPFADR
jgi:hypothetical protein